MITSFIFGVFFLAIGSFLLFSKYRTVVGGTLCNARVVRCDFGSTSRGITSYALIMGFTYNGEYLEKRSWSSTFSPRKAIGKQYLIYYNPKHTNYVVCKGFGLEILALLLVLLGSLFFVTFFAA